MAAGRSKVILQQEFHTFWDSGMRGDDFMEETAVVCIVEVDGTLTLTKVFYHDPSDVRETGADSAEDKALQWLDEEPLVHGANSMEITVYANYSPFSLMAEGLCLFLRNHGNVEKLTYIFVQLRVPGRSDVDAEETTGGLRKLVDNKVALRAMTDKDWQFLMRTLVNKQSLKKQLASNDDSRTRLQAILSQGTSPRPS